MAQGAALPLKTTITENSQALTVLAQLITKWETAVGGRPFITESMSIVDQFNRFVQRQSSGPTFTVHASQKDYEHNYAGGR